MSSSTNEMYILGVRGVLEAMLSNFGHGGAMAEIGCGFPTYRHNMTEAKRVFCGGRFSVAAGGGETVIAKKEN